MWWFSKTVPVDAAPVENLHHYFPSVEGIPKNLGTLCLGMTYDDQAVIPTHNVATRGVRRLAPADAVCFYATHQRARTKTEQRSVGLYPVTVHVEAANSLISLRVGPDSLGDLLADAEGSLYQHAIPVEYRTAQVPESLRSVGESMLAWLLSSQRNLDPDTQEVLQARGIDFEPTQTRLSDMPTAQVCIPEVEAKRIIEDLVNSESARNAFIASVREHGLLLGSPISGEFIGRSMKARSPLPHCNVYSIVGENGGMDFLLPVTAQLHIAPGMHVEVGQVIADVLPGFTGTTSKAIRNHVASLLRVENSSVHPAREYYDAAEELLSLVATWWLDGYCVEPFAGYRVIPLAWLTAEEIQDFLPDTSHLMWDLQGHLDNGPVGLIPVQNSSKRHISLPVSSCLVVKC